MELGRNINRQSGNVKGVTHLPAITPFKGGNVITRVLITKQFFGQNKLCTSLNLVRDSWKWKTIRILRARFARFLQKQKVLV